MHNVLLRNSSLGESVLEVWKVHRSGHPKLWIYLKLNSCLPCIHKGLWQQHVEQCCWCPRDRETLQGNHKAAAKWRCRWKVQCMRKLSTYGLPEHWVKVPGWYKCLGSRAVIYSGIWSQGTSGLDLKTWTCTWHTSAGKLACVSRAVVTPYLGTFSPKVHFSLTILKKVRAKLHLLPARRGHTDTSRAQGG